MQFTFQEFYLHAGPPWARGRQKEVLAAARAQAARQRVQRVRIHAIIRTHRAEPTRVHDRSTSRRRERRCVEVPRPAAAACRNGALEGAAVAAERAESARKFDGVPVVGPDEGPAGSLRAERVRGVAQSLARKWHFRALVAVTARSNLFSRSRWVGERLLEFFFCLCRACLLCERVLLFKLVWDLRRYPPLLFGQ